MLKNEQSKQKTLKGSSDPNSLILSDIVKTLSSKNLLIKLHI